MDTSVEQLAHAWLVTAGDQEVPVPATLRYTAADPLAVYLDFPPEAALHGREVTWTFARSLLDEGLEAPAGHGDVGGGGGGRPPPPPGVDDAPRPGGPQGGVGAPRPRELGPGAPGGGRRG
ncbi:SsgA family sporulation/cell division regulator, partial [Streptomyces sp. NPDC017252]|uniref:SsgA family sporulation/cell division regulator n=1 Tax=Streptomyces sp. NPDC017252 TaxID=3364988 RepID=UPI0037BDCEE6